MLYPFVFLKACIVMYPELIKNIVAGIADVDVISMFLQLIFFCEQRLHGSYFFLSVVARTTVVSFMQFGLNWVNLAMLLSFLPDWSLIASLLLDYLLSTCVFSHSLFGLVSVMLCPAKL